MTSPIRTVRRCPRSARTSGPTAGGTSVTINGANLSGATAVDFGTGNGATITSDTATQIIATSPSGTGTVDVTVTTAGGTSADLVGGPVHLLRDTDGHLDQPDERPDRRRHQRDHHRDQPRPVRPRSTSAPATRRSTRSTRRTDHRHLARGQRHGRRDGDHARAAPLPPRRADEFTYVPRADGHLDQPDHRPDRPVAPA